MDKLDTKTTAWLSRLIGDAFQPQKPSWSTQNNVYKITTPHKTYYLRIATDLKVEHNNLKTLRPFLRVPNVIGFEKISDKDHLLISALPGKNLCEFIGQWTNEEITKKFAVAVKEFHALDLHKIFPQQSAAGSVVLHGDMSLPNIMYTKEVFSGYIDVAKLSLGSADDDLADALWSLQRNLGPGYGELFLKEYGITTLSPKLTKALEFKYTL